MTTKASWKSMLFPALILLLIIIAAVCDNGLPCRLPFPCALLPLLIGGSYVCWSTVKATIAKRKITAGSLVVLALIGTTWAKEYLSGAIVCFMMIFGEALEELTMQRTQNAVRDLICLIPRTCRKLVNGAFQEVSIKTVRPGDKLKVVAGEQIPADGVICQGQASLNESSITGESLPVDKGIQDLVYAGSLNESGVLEFIVTKVGSSTVLGKIVKTVHMAQEKKGNAQRIADTFSNYFLPVILIACLFTFLLTKDAYRVMTILVIACPCALVLATPTAVIASVGNAARLGIIIKGGDSIERCAKIDTLCLDKTGTLTNGTPSVINTLILSDETEFFRALYITEENSGHPLAKAVLRYLDTKSFDVSALANADFEMLPGRGVKASCGEYTYEVSNKKLLEECFFSSPGDEASLKQFLSQEEILGRTVLIACADGHPLGALSLADTLRNSAKDTLVCLRKLGIDRILMLTGDNESTAKAICIQAGITEYSANLLPEDKLAILKKLQEEGRHVAMAGDGVNDAPALALADVGIAMGAAGTDLAVETADIALMGDRLEHLPFVFSLCRKTYRIICQNIIIFACIVNIAGVTLSGLGVLNPILGALIHNASSIFVVLNSSRMLKWKPDTIRRK